MTDFSALSDEELGIPADVLDPNIRAELRGARIQKREMGELQEQTKTALRQLALTKAGVDLTSPLGKLFEAGYAGPDDVEEIKAAWEALTPKAAPEDSPENQEGLDTEQRIADAGQAAQAASGSIDLEEAIKAVPIYPNDPARTQREVAAIIAAAPPEAGIRNPDIE